MYTKGFTLIELLIVIAIIGILSAVVLTSLDSARNQAQDEKKVKDLKQIAMALELVRDPVTGIFIDGVLNYSGPSAGFPPDGRTSGDIGGVAQNVSGAGPLIALLEPYLNPVPTDEIFLAIIAENGFCIQSNLDKNNMIYRISEKGSRYLPPQPFITVSNCLDP